MNFVKSRINTFFFLIEVTTKTSTVYWSVKSITYVETVCSPVSNSLCSRGWTSTLDLVLWLQVWATMHSLCVRDWTQDYMCAGKHNTNWAISPIPSSPIYIVTTMKKLQYWLKTLKVLTLAFIYLGYLVGFWNTVLENEYKKLAVVILENCYIQLVSVCITWNKKN